LRFDAPGNDLSVLAHGHLARDEDERPGPYRRRERQRLADGAGAHASKKFNAHVVSSWSTAQTWAALIRDGKADPQRLTLPGGGVDSWRRVIKRGLAKSP